MWADGNKRILNSQNYESATATDWTCDGNATLQSGDATYGKYAQCTPSGSGNRAISKSVSFSSEPTGATTAAMTTDGYNIEFDFLLVGGNVVKRSVSQFTLTTSGDPLFSLSQPTLAQEGANASIDEGKSGTAVTTWYVNDLTNATSETVTLSGSTWYHLKLVVTATSAAYTITNNSTSEDVKAGSKTITAITKITGFGGQVGRGSGKLNFDNLEIYDYTAEISVSTPTFTFKKVDGIKRVYTLTNPEGAGTLYYTTSPAGEAPDKGDAAYTSTTSTNLDIEYSESGTYYAYVLHSGGSATSAIASQTVTAGELTLAAPVFKIEDMVQAEDGYYYPKVSFVSTNSLEGNPVPTYSISSPYTFTGIGYVDVTASAEGYTSSTSRYTVSTKYTKSQTIDFGALTASDFNEDVWSSGTGAPRDLWTNRTAAIPTDVTYYGWKTLSITNGDETNTINSTSISGITISNPHQRTAQVYIGYGLLAPYDPTKVDGTAASTASNYLNFTVNGATAEDFIVYNGWNNYGSGTFNTVQAGNATFGLYRYDTMLRTINVYSPTSVYKTITTAGWATYCSSYILDFSGDIANLTDVYIVTGNTGTTLSLLEVTGKVPANTGLLLKGNGTCVIPVATESDVDVSENILVGVTAETEITAEAGYVLMSTPSLGFYKNENAFKVGANTAYIDATQVSGLVKMLNFSEEATGIAAPEVAEKAEDGVLYNTAGQQVTADFKGIVIKNGKKFLNK